MPRNPNCQGCALAHRAETVCVWGRQTGENPRIMIVGEAPDGDDDVAGSPFVGPSGAKIREALRKANITQPYYVTHAVKCRSDGPPKGPSVKACKSYLEEEIAAVKPDYILALGATAWHWFGQGAITSVAGKEVWSDQYNCWIMPTLHPKAILRDVNKEPSWIADIQRFGVMAGGKLQAKVDLPIMICDTEEALTNVIETLRESEAFSYDFECNIVPWWSPHLRIQTLAFAGRDRDGTLGSLVVPIDHYEHQWNKNVLEVFLRLLAPIMSDPGKSKSPHNGFYDDLIFYRMTGILPYPTFDTMVAAHVDDENRQKSLKYLGRSILGWPDWDIDATKAPYLPKHQELLAVARQLEKAGTITKEYYKELQQWCWYRRSYALDDLASYNGHDAAATFLLREHFMRRFQEQPQLLRYFAMVEMPKIRGVEEIMATGVHVDLEKWHARYPQLVKEIEEAAAVLPVENPGSTQQIAEWLYERKRLPIVKLTPGGKPSTDESTITELALDYPAVRPVLEYRGKSKMKNTYYEPIYRDTVGSWDGRFHAEYRSTSVETGRLASFFHTTPQDPFVRSLFTARPGWVLVEFDYSQIEARLAAWAAGGKPSTYDGSPYARMMMAFMDGRDIYRETAAEYLHKALADVTKEDRQLFGKVPVLASLYRISPQGLREYVWKKTERALSIEEATHLWNSFNTLWPEFHLWHEKEEKTLKARGYAQSPIGRIRRLPAAQLDDSSRLNKIYVQEAVRSGINMPIQSVASDITEKALDWIYTKVPHYFGKDHRMLYEVGTVHDALLFEVRNEDMEQLLPVLHRAMLYAPKLLEPLGLVLPKGLIQVECKVGPWGEGKEYHFDAV